MSLTVGTRLGAYEILSAIGAGGMGEVYRARDGRLGRDVAVKVLPAALANDADRLARFEQEARATAALNHPNILAVFDVGRADVDGIAHTYLVSELLEGETLRDALVHGALPLRHAVAYATQIAHGLAAAHEKGIVHRDLKPDNVFVTRDGRVKILDFGLAKLTEIAHTSGTMLPTTPAGSMAGMMIGTIGYMAPEQVRGLAVDARADIFAFGAVLYEMLTGERAFAGDTAADTVSAILKEEPPLLAGPDRIGHAPLQRVVQRCLEKKAEQRFHSAHDLAYAIEAASAQTRSGVAAVVETSEVRAPKKGQRALAIAAAAVTIAALGLLWPAVRYWTAKEPLRLTRFVVPLPEGTTWAMGSSTPFLPAPDGRSIAMVLAHEGGSRLWVHRLDVGDTRPIPGTDGVRTMTWSPDSLKLAFTVDDVIKRMALDGGPAETILNLKGKVPGMIAWGAGDEVLWAAARSAVARVPRTAGEPPFVTALEPGDAGHAGPTFLPDGRRFLFQRNAAAGRLGVYVGSVDGASPRSLLPDALMAFVSGDYILYGRDRAVVAQPFDGRTATLRAAPVVLVDGVRPIALSQRLAYAAALQAPVLAYQTGENEIQMAWVGRDGRELARVATGSFTTLALSRDDARIAFGRADGQSGQAIWTTDSARNVTSRLTPGPRDSDPAWSSDGRRLAFTTTRDDGKHVLIMPSAGGAPIEVYRSQSVASGIDDWSRDGRYLLLHDTPAELLAIDLEQGNQKVSILKASTGLPPDEAAFSPDGRAVAFNTREATRPEVYIKAFPPTGEQWQLSNAGGMQPRWREDGRELYYMAPDGTMMVVEIQSPPPSLKASAPRPLFKTRIVPQGATEHYAVTHDGQRFLLLDPIADDRLSPLHVIVDWPALLKK